MKSQYRLLLLLTALFYFVQPSYAQDEGEEGDCYLPAPQDIFFNSVGPDHLDFYWTPVLNANDYEVTIIDLNTNFVIHSSIEYATQFFISGIVVTQSTFVIVAALCENGIAGESTVTSTGPLTRVFEDLVLESTTPGGTVINHVCGDIDYTKMDPDWTGSSGLGILSYSVNAKSEVVAEIDGTIQNGSGANHHPLSLLILGKKSSPYSLFPSYNSSRQQFINTLASRSTSTTGNSNINATINYNQLNHNFYEVIESSTISNTVDLSFNSIYSNNIMVTTRYCARGAYQEFKENPGNLVGLQSSDNGGEMKLDQMYFYDQKKKPQEFEFKLSPNPVSNKININLPTEFLR